MPPPLVPPLRVVFTGASGQGKSTMARYVASAFGLPLVGRSGREVALALGVEHRDIDARNMRAVYQRAVAETTVEALETPGPFVCDRGLDFAVYAALEGAAGTADVMLAAQAADALRRCLVFVVEPSVDVTAAARAERGPVKYLDWRYVLRVDGGVRTLLALHGVPFQVIPTDGRAEREAWLRAVIGGHPAGKMAAVAGRREPGLVEK